MNRIAIIAAGGKIPKLIAERAKKEGENPFIVGIEGQTNCEFSNFDYLSFPPGKLALILKNIIEKKCDRVIFSGSFIRPKFKDFMPDKLALKLLGKFILSGDDDSLRKLKHLFEENGISVISQKYYLKDRFLSKDYRIGKKLTMEEIKSVNFGIKVLNKLGDLDVGQSIVIQQKRVIAIECSEGTDKMILRAKKLIDKSTFGSVFIKMAKTHQDINQDVPVIGLKTIMNLYKSEIMKVAVQSNYCMLADDLIEIENLIKKLKMSLISVE